MKIVRFKGGGKTRYGVLEGTHVVEYAGTPFGPFKRGRKKYPARQTVFLAPVVPSKIICVGLNYRDHAEEMRLPVPDEPVLFLKPPSALCGPGDPIVLPAGAGRVDYEAELAVVIKKHCRHVPAERAREHVLGYTCVNDVTARELQARDGRSVPAKAFDSFCPVGPCIVTDIDPRAVEIESFVNGERKQASNTKNLRFGVEELVAHVSSVMTLAPGDIIATGTPGGTGPLRPGDKVEVRIEGIGSLTNPVITV